MKFCLLLTRNSKLGVSQSVHVSPIFFKLIFGIAFISITKKNSHNINEAKGKWNFSNKWIFRLQRIFLREGFLLGNLIWGGFIISRMDVGFAVFFLIHFWDEEVNYFFNNLFISFNKLTIFYFSSKKAKKIHN